MNIAIKKQTVQSVFYKMTTERLRQGAQDRLYMGQS